MSSVDHRAREFARTAHRDQLYNAGSGSFLDQHLSQVVATLVRFGETDPVLLAAGWLHDVIEDTPTSEEIVREQFGEEVAELVSRLTDERDGSRRERQLKTHLRIRELPGAVRVKLADRIANVEASLETNSPLLGMYRKEFSLFREQLHRAGEYEEMWSYLYRLLFVSHDGGRLV